MNPKEALVASSTSRRLVPQLIVWPMPDRLASPWRGCCQIVMLSTRHPANLHRRPAAGRISLDGTITRRNVSCCCFPAGDTAITHNSTRLRRVSSPSTSAARASPACHRLALPHLASGHLIARLPAQRPVSATDDPYPVSVLDAATRQAQVPSVETCTSSVLWT